VVPYGKQASWALGVLLFETASGGQHPLGDGYPGVLLDGTRVVSGGVEAAVGGYSMASRVSEVLCDRPAWYRDVVVGLLRVNTSISARLSLSEATSLLMTRGERHSRTIDTSVSI